LEVASKAQLKETTIMVKRKEFGGCDGIPLFLTARPDRTPGFLIIYYSPGKIKG
jgi:hypothetical protein